MRDCRGSFTSFTVRLSPLHVKGLVPNGSFAGCTHKALNMVGHLQGVHDLLQRTANDQLSRLSGYQIVGYNGGMKSLCR